MGILDGPDHTFSAVINGIEHFAANMTTLVEHSVSELASYDISVSGTIPWLIQHLIELGEDPVEVITHLSTRISEMGVRLLKFLKKLPMV